MSDEQQRFPIAFGDEMTIRESRRCVDKACDHSTCELPPREYVPPERIGELERSFQLRQDAAALYGRLYRSEALNAELTRMLKDVEWSSKGRGCGCPWCHAKQYNGRHLTDCALAALLKKAVTE